jgi:hypothetical protein
MRCKRAFNHSIKIYQRDVYGLLAVAARSIKLVVVKAPKTKPDRRTAAVGKRRVSTGTRGVQPWVTITDFIMAGEMKGEDGRMAQSHAV